jgi:hypothetical protein
MYICIVGVGSFKALAYNCRISLPGFEIDDVKGTC